MVAILRPYRWSVQPQGPVAVDLSNPFAQQLEVALIASDATARNLAGHQEQFVKGLGAVRARRRCGTVWNGDNYNTNIYYDSPAGAGSLANRFRDNASMLWVGELGTNGVSWSILCGQAYGPGTSAPYAVALLQEDSGGVPLTVASNSAGSQNYTVFSRGSGGTADGVAEERLIGVIDKNADTLTAMSWGVVSGLKVSSASNAMTQASILNDGTDRFFFNGNGNSYPTTSGRGSALGLAWSRALTRAEQAEIIARPYQVFKAATIRSFYEVAAAPSSNANYLALLGVGD